MGYDEYVDAEGDTRVRISRERVRTLFCVGPHNFQGFYVARPQKSGVPLGSLWALVLVRKENRVLASPPALLNDRQLLGPFSKHVCVCSICPKEGSHFLSFYFHLFVFRVGHCLGNIQPLYWLPWNERLHSWLGFMKRTRLFRDHPRGLKCTRGCVVALIIAKARQNRHYIPFSESADLRAAARAPRSST